MAESITSYCATTVRESVGDLASALVIPPFFFTEGTFDRSWMHIETKFNANQSCQFACPNWPSGDKPCLEKRQHVTLDLVWTMWPSLPRHQSRDPTFLEVRPGLKKVGRETPYSSETDVTDAFSTETRRNISYFTCKASCGSKKLPS
ncbi:hypothetical protein B0G80_1280 [Paraburkholderia sp. BL6669N2]|uniref:hypothetical protein n=1 Tax=Paraburkholderia sp. BL6669N2 TaxID=1938807 RepID=UPI000E3AF3DE|nr:hypothetical protein [Paraburkholderia sp. BL6669N2]REG58620.1 hypothetical protein B0G80_1280 [Paraburkholderia sp. BL6669N2]